MNKRETGRTNRPRLLLLLAMGIFGSIGIFVRYIPLPSALIALTRGAVGTLFLLLVAAVRKQRPSLTAILRNLPILCLSGVAIGVNWILLFESYRYVSVATATLCYYMAPVFVILLSPLLLRERLTLRKLGCAAVAVAGMILVSGVLQPGTNSGNARLGVLFGLGAAVLYASVVLMSKRLTGISAYDTTLVQLGAASVALLPYTLCTLPAAGVTLSPRTLVLLLIVGVLHTGVAYTLYFASLQGQNAQTVAIFSYLDPVVAIVLSTLLLRERMIAAGAVGAVLILGATFVYELVGARGQPAALRPMRRGEIRRWYATELAEAFAPQERKPLADILALHAAGRYDIWGLFVTEGGEKRLIGYATVWHSPDVASVLLDYLGVTAARRNEGLGGRILTQLFVRYPDRRVLVESELPTQDGTPEENGIRTRRIAFYERNGFVPVYEMATCGLRWQALCSGATPLPDTPEMQALMTEHRMLYGPDRADVRIPLPPDATPAQPYWMQGE